MIAYGGDHALETEKADAYEPVLPKNYGLTLCRIEPENNVDLILAAFSEMEMFPLVVIGNWDDSPYGRGLKRQYEHFDNLVLLDPIYDLGILRLIGEGAALYVHGHSAGGTNPSLVEMMHFGKLIFAYDFIFNRCTTEGRRGTLRLRTSL